jgi:hypothetical protein
MEIRDIEDIIGYQVQGTADWRRRKAEEFPNDTRNQAAALALDRLAEEIAELAGSDVHRRIDALIDLTVDVDLDWGRLNETVSAELRAIGFHDNLTGAEFLEWYYEELKELLQDRVNNDDNDIAAPDLAAQVENDEAVKAAKRTYDEARAKAYAEARKRI